MTKSIVFFCACVGLQGYHLAFVHSVRVVAAARILGLSVLGHTVAHAVRIIGASPKAVAYIFEIARQCERG